MSNEPLKGMTWSHPRGYDPMVACSKLWLDKTGVEIAWDKRSLQDFESFPVEELARNYDLIVIDHPHVGQITEEDCLTPLDVAGHEEARAALVRGNVGRSFDSYRWKGRQWAFPIDAAAQVQMFRPDLIERGPVEWEAVVDLARDGRVMLPLRPPHNLMSFYTLAANLGVPCASDGARLIDADTGERVLGMLAEIAGLIDPACFEMDPIAVSEAMARGESKIVCAPLIYGYVSYAMDGFREHRLAFCDIPEAGGNGPVGSALGGTGIAVSARSKRRDAAIDFAHWIAGGAIQRGPYAAAGGQPGHAEAWEDAGINAATGDFYAATRATLEAGWVRPRHNGYMAFQQVASDRIGAWLSEPGKPRRLVEELNALFEHSRQDAGGMIKTFAGR